MKLFNTKKWDEYSEEEKDELMSFWWNDYGKNALTTSLDYFTLTSWWFLFGKAIITLDEWKKLKRLEKTDSKRIDTLKSIYCDLNLPINRKDTGSFSNEFLIDSLVNAYNNKSLIDIKPNSKQFIKK